MKGEIKERVEHYIAKAKPLFEKLEVITKKPEDIDWEYLVKEFQDMTLRYWKDALYFYERGEYVNALAALEYAEGWLDAGKRIGIFKV